MSPTSGQASGPWLKVDTAGETGLPLAGVRVLDLSRVLAGPFAAQVLGDLGADVIKVEQPDVGDPVRQLAPPRHGSDATYYLSTNRNRRSIALDLAADGDQSVLVSLVETADIVIENFLPHQRDAFGLDALRQRFAEVVWISVLPASAPGPLSSLPAFDLLAQGRSGLMGVTGSPASGPIKTGAPIADVFCGLYAAVAALAGLRERELRGVGSHYEAPLLECAISALANQATGYLATGRDPVLLGNDHPSIVPYGAYAASDGLLLIAAGTERQYQHLCAALGRFDLATDDRFATNDARVNHAQELRATLESILISKARQHWMDVLGSAGVPVSPVNSVAEALHEPQIQGGDLLVEISHEAGPIEIVASPLVRNGARLPVRTPPPSLDEHGASIRASLEST